MVISSKVSPPDWIAEGEKYALIGLDVEAGNSVTSQNLPGVFWILRDFKLRLPTYWSEWLGSIRCEEIENCNVFLLCKEVAANPEVLDKQSQDVSRRARDFYSGLLLSFEGQFGQDPILLVGERTKHEISVRQHGVLPSALRPIARLPRELILSDLVWAALVATQLELLTREPPKDGCWRLLTSLRIYLDARANLDCLDRIHQYCRSVEALILPRAGDTKSQFRSRTELFIGPTHHELIGKVYDLRSDVEHLNANKHLEFYEREKRVEIAKYEAIIENIARTALLHIFSRTELVQHFANHVALNFFWKLEANKRTEIWGDQIDPLGIFNDFDVSELSDHELGKYEE